MGCFSQKDSLENKIKILKLERMEVQLERSKKMKQLEEMDNRKIQKCYIPDYIDPDFARENNLLDCENTEIKKNDKKRNKADHSMKEENDLKRNKKNEKSKNNDNKEKKIKKEKKKE